MSFLGNYIHLSKISVVSLCFFFLFLWFISCCWVDSVGYIFKKVKAGWLIRSVIQYNHCQTSLDIWRLPPEVFGWYVSGVQLTSSQEVWDV